MNECEDKGACYLKNVSVCEIRVHAMDSAMSFPVTFLLREPQSEFCEAIETW